ncbi:MAG: NAD(+) diphosphatase [Pseudomonadota bacterium]
MPEMPHVTFAAGSGHLDRAAHLRDVADDFLRHRRAALLPLFHGKILIDLEEPAPRLGWVPPLPEYLEEATEAPVFLGLSDGTPCFAADFTAMETDVAERLFCDGAKFIDLRSIAGELRAASASIAAVAKGLLNWHETHPFCARCGGRTTPDHGGWRRRCEDCGAVHFPRTDPVVIMLVVHEDSVLLGRQAQFPPGIYSLLAGFMEPGETVEDAVRRETKEETAVQVGRVGYLGCQPWPFPSNLMLGCWAEAETTDIRVDPEELEDAQWITRAKMQVILEGKHPRIKAPRKDAIARAILTDWVQGDLSIG